MSEQIGKQLEIASISIKHNFQRTEGGHLQNHVALNLEIDEHMEGRIDEDECNKLLQGFVDYVTGAYLDALIEHAKKQEERHV